MAFLDLFRPEWQHSDPKRRIAALGKLHVPWILFEIARNDSDSGVRAAAAERLARTRFRQEYDLSSRDHKGFRDYVSNTIELIQIGRTVPDEFAIHFGDKDSGGILAERRPPDTDAFLVVPPRLIVSGYDDGHSTVRFGLKPDCDILAFVKLLREVRENGNVLSYRMVFIVGPQSWRGSPTPDAEAIVKELAQGVVKTSPCFLKKTLFVINDGPSS
jgi:hypothetical protein